MQYLTVRALDALDRSLLEVDVPLSELVPLLDGIEENLRQQGVFDPYEKLLKRFVPRFDSTEGITARVADRPQTDLGEAEFGIHYEQEPGEPLRPLKSLALWFYAPAIRRLCSIDLPINWLLRSAQEHLRQELRESQRIKRTGLVHFDAFLHGRGEVRLVSGGARVKLILLLPSQELLENDRLDQSGAIKPVVDVKITSRQSLVTPVKRSWRNSEAKVIGKPLASDLRVLVSNTILHDLNQVARSSLQRDAEVGGFLMGQVCEDEEGKLFIDITDAPAGDAATGTFLSLRYDPEAWRQAFDDLSRRFPGKHRIGWYHTHLPGARRLQPVASSMYKDQQVYDLVDMTFFSGDDVALHRSFFSEPWQVAMVINLKKKGVMFFQWKNNSIVPCSAFYTYDPLLQHGG